jgi:predicted amidophosphoribosyltransferase
MILQIDGFPHAQFDSHRGRGYLCQYFKIKSISEELWRSTYSPDILDFKEGKETTIDQFAQPFVQLIEYTLKAYRASTAILVPVPSSMSRSDPGYSGVPFDKTKTPKRKNRDDRCELFCNRIAKKCNSTLLSLSLIRRTRSKAEKSNRTKSSQMKTLECDLSLLEQVKNCQSELIILIDDIETTGSTFSACHELLRKQFPNSKIACLAIAKTTDSKDFQPLVSQK